MSLGHLQRLEAEAIQIIREGVAEADNPVILFSAGKDSTVLAHLAMRAFYPSKPPVPLLHIDSTWEFPEVLAFRDDFAKRYGFNLKVSANEEGRAMGLNPIADGSNYTRMMRTDALKGGLDAGGYDVIFGGARRDEEASRAKERIVSVRNEHHGWEPKNQRPELWSIYNWRRSPKQTLRAFPISNWTEYDLWAYIINHKIELAPLYYAAERPVVETEDGMIYLAENERDPGFSKYAVTTKKVRFRTLGCWPVTAASASEAETAEEILHEVMSHKSSERMGRVSDAGSLEDAKRSGYF